MGDHIYGSIVKAKNKETKEQVIIKMFKKKFYTWEDIMSLREIKVLRILNHPNIIKMKEILKEKDELSCVYENTQENLFEWYQDFRDKGNTISEENIKNIMYQVT